MNPSGEENAFRTIHYDGKKITARTMTRQEVVAIDVQSVDHFTSDPHGRLAFQNNAGLWVEHDGAGLGDTTLAILEVLQDHPGEFLNPFEVARLTGYPSLAVNGNLSQRLKKLRDAHGETPRDPMYFCSRRKCGFGVCWPRERTWMRVVRHAVQ